MFLVLIEGQMRVCSKISPDIGQYWHWQQQHGLVFHLINVVQKLSLGLCWLWWGIALFLLQTAVKKYDTNSRGSFLYSDKDGFFNQATGSACGCNNNHYLLMAIACKTCCAVTASMAPYSF